MTKIIAWRLRGYAMALCVVFSSSVGGAAEDGVIVPDRPGLAESSVTVGAGRGQLEVGFGYERFKRDGSQESTRTIPALFRFGLTPNTEFRLESDAFTSFRSHDDAAGETVKQTGYSDLALGIKWHARDGDEQAGTPALALLAHADLDSGSSEFRGKGVRPSLRGVAEWDLPNDWQLGAMAGVLYDNAEQTGRFYSGILGVALTKEISEGLAGFVKWSGAALRSKANGGAVISYGGGLTYRLSKDVQLDAALSLGANGYSPDWAATCGVSVRF